MKQVTALTLTLAATVASAHHGSNGQFNHDVDVDVAGVVTDVKLVNPHAYVYFDVTNDEDVVEPWRCEMRAGSLLKRNGWTADLFSPGTSIVVHGSAARREEFGCYLRSVTFDDGRVVQRSEEISFIVADESVVTDVQLAPGTPNINGNWVRQPRDPGAPRGGNAPYAPTALNESETADFHREMNPRFHCQVTNIFHDWTFDGHVNTITQTDDEIVLTYGFMDLVRTIQLDMDSHPDDITPSRGGHSIGTWEGDTLVVDTVGFLPGWLAATRVGIRHGDQMHTTERFTLSEDGQTLYLSYTVTDPEYLAGPYNGQAAVVRTAAAFDPYECEDLTEEIVEGF